MKNKTTYLAIAIFIIGIFLRIYHITDWLHFELDQARDVFIVSDAINGTRDLPLLGPQARGRELQLGPIFYYFQFVFAKIFGVSPVTVVFPDLLFSILTIPLSYLFARQFFSKRISFLLFILTSFSYFLIFYGRFAWNPNSMPFWSMLAAYALLRTSKKSQNDSEKVFCLCDEHNFLKALILKLKFWFNDKFFVNKEISWWFVLAVFATSILVQLHFIAFLCFPVAFVVYFIFSKIQISWKTVLISLFTMILLFLPIIVNEYKTGGQNTKGLISSVKEDRNDNHDVIEKTFRAFQETATFYFTIFTGDQHGRDLLVTKKATQGYFPLVCDKTCKERLPYLILAMIFFVVSLSIFVLKLFTFSNLDFSIISNFNKSDRKEIFLMIKIFFKSVFKNLLKNESLTFLILPWLLMGGLFLTLVAYKISPRFYLFIYPPFLILLGSVFCFIEKVFVRFGKFIMRGFVFVLILLNLVIVKNSFAEMNDSRNENIGMSRDIVMERSDVITLGQLNDVANYILEREKDNKTLNKIVVGDNRYARAIYYLVNSESEKDVLSCYIKRGGFEKESVLNRNFYVLVREKSGNHINDEMLEKHNIVDEKYFGTLKLYELEFKYSAIMKTDKPNGCFIR